MAVVERELTAPALPDTEADGARPIRWTRDQYHRMSEAGLFEGLRVELIAGEIIETPAIGSRHFTSVGLTTRVLLHAFGEHVTVMPQNGFTAGPDSEPQPDVAVYSGDIRDFKDALPNSALLMVEVADTTLRTDRTKKARLCAGANVPEYWIVNLRDELLEVHRQPITDSSSPVAYQSIQSLRATDTVSPLAAPDCAIIVSDLLP